MGSLSPRPQRPSSAKAATAKACITAGCMKRLPRRCHSPLRAHAELCCLPLHEQVFMARVLRLRLHAQL